MINRGATEAPSWMFSIALNHRQKRSLREMANWYLPERLEVRFQQRIIRARFEANRDEKDPRKASILLADGCRQLWENHANDPFGAAYDRAMNIPENMDDDEYTYPEREQFPYYFNRREQRKKELLDHWHKIDKDWDEEIENIQKQLPKERPVISAN